MAARLLVLGRLEAVVDLFDTSIREARWVLELAPDLESACRRLGRRHFDLVLADIGDIPLSPREVLERMRAVKPEIRVIMLDDEAEPAEVIEALRGRAFSYFARPFEISLVRDTMLKALEPDDDDDGIDLLSGDPDYISLALRCRMNTAERLQQFFAVLRTDLTPGDRLTVAAAFREMLMNAIEHGGKMNPNERVRVSRVRTKRTLVYYIQDPGKGFNRSQLPHAASADPGADPTAHLKVREEKGLRMGGFGLLVTKKLVDEVIYNEQGNEVILIKYLDAISAS